MTENYFVHSRLMWEPLDPYIPRVEAFRRMINHKHGLKLKDYHDLHKYSVEDYTFWLDLWEFVGIISSVPPSKHRIIVPPTAPGVLHPVWFPDARLNYAENLLIRSDDGIAVTASREDGRVSHYTWRQLKERVRSIAAAMKGMGVVAGDRIAGIITNCFDAIAVALAAASIGAIFSSTATDMGTQGILERYRQIRPKLVFADVEVLYAGKVTNIVSKVAHVAKELVGGFGLERVILLPSSVSGEYVDSNAVVQSTSLEEFLKTYDNGQPLEFAQLPFNQPLYILYSSGTSGPPKCIVHTAGGCLLQNKKDSGICFGFLPDDTYFQYTTTGWMMWPYMLSAFSCGTRIIAYDGSPFYPDVRGFLKFVSRERVTVLGISPRFMSEIKSREIHPLDLAPFDSLRTLFCTGAVLTPPMFEFAQRSFGRRVHVASGSGGTDICSSFVTCVASMPVYTGEIQAKSLGMKVEIFSPSGENIEDTGEPGELVCTRPHPSLPARFWGDEKGEKLRAAYYDTFPGVWRQGDFMVKNPKTKGFIILGRSDGVLNPSGVRFGSAEIYSVLERFSDTIDDSLCVGQRRVGRRSDENERVLLFLKMKTKPGKVNERFGFTPKLDIEIRAAIREALSIRHVPAFIFEIEDIPYTVNNKKIEIAVKQIVSGSSLKPSGTVANPDSLRLFYRFYDLEDQPEVKGATRVVKTKL